MQLKNQKKLASKILKVSPKKVKLDSSKSEEIKEAITRADIKNLINQGLIYKDKSPFSSKVRARKNKIQKRKGRQKGPGSKKGTQKARLKEKKAWMNKVRSQRQFIRRLKEGKLINPQIYQKLYLKIKGGFFRNKRHIKLYLDEHDLIEKKMKARKNES